MKKAKRLKKLGDRNYLLIKRGVKSFGTFNPEEIMCMFEEDLYVSEAQEVENFLKWVHETGKSFGSGNYEEVFAEYLKATPDYQPNVVEFAPITSITSFNVLSESGWKVVPFNAKEKETVK